MDGKKVYEIYESMSVEESPASLLQRAADKLSEMAAAATSGTWRARSLPREENMANVVVGEQENNLASLFGSSCCGGHCYGHVNEKVDAKWIATMSPAVAQPLVSILRGVAFTLDCHPEYAEMERNYIELARLILGEVSGE